MKSDRRYLNCNKFPGFPGICHGWLFIDGVISMAIFPLIDVAGEWVDLYAATGVTVGNALLVQNFNSDTQVALSDSATEPTDATGRVRINAGDFYQVDAGSAGAWAYCPGVAKISVQEL